MTTPKTEDVRKAVSTAIDQVRTPLLAALGAGNLASQAVTDAVAKARKSGEQARKNLGALPTDVESLRGKLDPAELRKAIDEYTEAALKLYNQLAESGEQAWDKIAAQPQVKKALEQLDEALHTAQSRVDGLAEETRGRVDGVLAKVTKRTRSAGEKAARKVSEAADETATAVEELGDDLAHEARSVTRKAANRTAPKTASPAGRTSTTGSTTSATTAAKKPAAPKTEK